jgi:GNAT superfamily N-acetyltransferase
VPFDILARIPTPVEHRLLCESVGWQDAFEWEAMPASLAASVAGVVVLDEGRPIGMGRVVGDGVFYFYIQDVAVLPEYQERGIGTRILESLVEQVERVASPKGFIGLFAAGRAAALYERHGFAAHPGMTGMFQVVQQPAAASI